MPDGAPRRREAGLVWRGERTGRRGGKVRVRLRAGVRGGRGPVWRGGPAGRAGGEGVEVVVVVVR